MKKVLFILPALMSFSLSGCSLLSKLLNRNSGNTGSGNESGQSGNNSNSGHVPTGNLISTASSINAGTYTVNFTVTPTDSQLELSHVATGAEASSGLAGIAAASLNEGDLVYGIISNGAATMRKCATSSNFISGYTIAASWASAPTDPADVAYLGGKSFTINLGVTGQAKLLASNGVTGLVNATSATAVVHIAASTLALTVDTYSHAYVHIEPFDLSWIVENPSTTVGGIVVIETSAKSLFK